MNPVSEPWTEMEAIVQATVFGAREAARGRGELWQYYRELQCATAELFKLSDCQNVDYAVPRAGEAYALWFHMRRVANVYQALQSFKKHVQAALWSSKPWRALDVGSGTGAVSMALMRWLEDNRAEADADPFDTCSVTCIEASPEMARIGDEILERYAQALDRRLDVTVNTCSLEQWVAGDEDEFDFIVFSTTFDYLHGDARDAMLRQVVSLVDRHLAEWGVVLFLVPKSKETGTTKWTFVQDVCRELRELGIQRLAAKEDPALRPPNDVVQETVLDTRERLYQEAIKLDPPIFIYRAAPRQLPEGEQPRYFSDVHPFALRRFPEK